MSTASTSKTAPRLPTARGPLPRAALAIAALSAAAVGYYSFSQPSTPPQPKLISAATVQVHNGKEGNPAWVIVDGTVYDVTKYAPTHVIGPGSIIKHSGEDITNVFNHIHKPATIAKLLEDGKITAVGQADPEGQTIMGGSKPKSS